MARIRKGARFHGPAVDAANACYRDNLAHAKDLNSWQRATRWMTEFEAYAKKVYAQSKLRFDLADAVHAHRIIA